jgi:hypothetical protein
MEQGLAAGKGDGGGAEGSELVNAEQQLKSWNRL